MAIARKKILPEGKASVVHCISRCVRRAYLCGMDEFSGKSYEHRRGWIKQRIQELSGIFAVEVLAYAVMSNHTHLVIKIDPQKAMEWSDGEVADKWNRIFPFAKDEQGLPRKLDQTDIKNFGEDTARVDLCRKRLGDISWMMRCLNEPIARMANQEDGCKGRFWEGRFKSQLLADEGAVLACMAYVDLNPIRAKVAETPEQSDYTSIQDRLIAHQAREKLKAAAHIQHPKQEKMMDHVRQQSKQDNWLYPLGQKDSWLHIRPESYMELVEWTGRMIRSDKPGSIPKQLDVLLKRMELDRKHWVDNVRAYGSLYYSICAKSDKMLQLAKDFGQKWFCIRQSPHKLFDPSPQPS